MPPVSSARLTDVPAETLYRLLWLRVSVFVVEQAAAYPELDGRDLEPDTELFWIEDDGRMLATLRLLRDASGNARIGRVATAADARGRGLSAQLMRAAVDRAGERWPGAAIDLDAQKHLADWYGRFGFAISGPEFSEDDIPHVPMRRSA